MQSSLLRAGPAIVAFLCFLIALLIDGMVDPRHAHPVGPVAGFAMLASIFAPPVVTACAPRLWLLGWAPGVLL
jgi:hypothetical protein